MNNFDNILSKPGRVLIGGCPEGFDSQILAQRCLSGIDPVSILHIARDESHLVTLAEEMAFFAPGLEVLRFPAWDSVPYDRVSPHSEVVARRVETLSKLAGKKDNGSAPFIVITTVSAFLQKVPPKSLFAGAMVDISTGGRVDLDEFTAFLVTNGYHRAETVREPGEYALRGGLIDIFPPGTLEPLRLDLFGDEVENIRAFDPMTQLTTGKRDSLSLIPVNEMTLDEESITRFRTRYRELFGVAGGSDPLYEAISAGRRFDGMEHWLPLFHQEMARLSDYMPAGHAVTFDHQAIEARTARLEMIDDYYEARKAMTAARQAMELTYKPLPPEYLFLDAKEWDALTLDRPVGVFSPFKTPEDATPDDYIASIDAGGRGGRDFSTERTQPGANLFDAVSEVIKGEKRPVVITAYSPGARERLTSLLKDHGIEKLVDVENWGAVQALPASGAGLAVLPLDKGFRSPQALFISEQDILGQRLARPAAKRRRAEDFIAEASSLTEGDLVVHVDHGVGRFDGLLTIDVGGAPHDCVQLTYEGGDKLFVPVENIEILSRYGSEGAGRLDKLGGASWQARKARVKKRIKDIADELIKIAAARALREGEEIIPPAGLYEEFCARFPYPETEDQNRAIDDMIADLNSGRPMDRLICGDVGFGKTEVALRAAFIAAMSGIQVAVVTPTTLLCRQHFQTFCERFAGLPLRIEQLSRLTPAKKASDIRDGMKSGDVNIVIGTHTLLGKNIAFSHLGMLILDEEQHFGVVQKECLKQLRADIHILTLTATPIPRTLQMALSGVREMSLIATPPVDRLAVRTFVLPFDPVVVREAILREQFRGGQTFYVCPRIEDLDKVGERLKELVQEVKVVTAHGRMSPAALEGVMEDFYDGRFDVLLSTTIIESGLDIPRANTLIVHRADMFGLSQLYQIRGRIGRSKMRAYAYLTLPPGRILSTAAQRRLEVLHNLDTLGAGFTLASHDLDIRGAGNLLGDEQSGHIREVGVELYQHMIEEAVATARDIGDGGGEAAREGEDVWSPQIAIGSPTLIPENYVADLGVRLSLYRRIAHLTEHDEIDAFAVELSDRFGPVPQEVNNLLDLVSIKQQCRIAGVEKVEAGTKGAIVSFRKDSFSNPAGLVEYITSQAGTVKLRPDQKLIYRRDWVDEKVRLKGVVHLMRRLCEIVQAGGAESAA